MREFDEYHKYGLVKTSRTTWEKCNCKVCNAHAVSRKSKSAKQPAKEA